MASRLNLAWIVWGWQLEWNKGWVPDSTDGLGCEVKFKLIHEDEFSNNVYAH